MSFKVLLLQARRSTDPVRVEEQQSFAHFSGLEREQVVAHDLLSGTPSLDVVRKYDALMIGGSGEFYVSKGHLPSQERVLELLQEVVRVDHPTFASCFGFHLMVEALGGEIIHDPENVEVGTHDVELTEEATEDPLLSILPSSFSAQMGRKDRAARLPEGTENLASTPLCPLQAFRYPDRMIWATQFHPELDERTNRGRYLRYLEGYAAHMDDEERERALANFRPSPHTAPILRRFVELVAG